MIIVGLGKAYHDCSVCAYIDGIIRYAKYEREVSRKHARAPEQWYYRKLIDWGIDLDSIDVIVETHSGFYNGEFKYEKLPLAGANVLSYYKGVEYNLETKHVIIDHHLAHSWSNTNFNEESQSVVMDGWGSGGHTSMIYNNNKIIRSKDYSPGTTLAAIGGRIGLKHGAHVDNAGKVMGLVPYGIPNMEHFNKLKSIVPRAFKDLVEQIHYADVKQYNEGSLSDKKFTKLMETISTINELCYDVVRRNFQTLNKTKPIVYSGGCALNVDWNRRLIDDGYKLSIQPHVYDGGLSIGCMRYGFHMIGQSAPKEISNFPYIQDDVAPNSKSSQFTIDKIADLLARGKIVAWYQGNGELGPRALGNRSILMDPSIRDGKEILNNKVKRREWFRPFGASVKKDRAGDYFDLNENPYMLFTSNLTTNTLPAITHVDNTCRHQTVEASSNELFYSLLDSFERKTGLPVLLNTSLNLGGKPIAGTPEEAIELLKTTELDVVCIGDEVITK